MPVSLSLAELDAAVSKRSAGRLHAVISDAGDVRLSGIAALSAATKSDLTFLANPMYRREALSTGAGAIVLSAVDHKALQAQSAALPAIAECDQPYAWFAYAAQILNPGQAVEGGVAGGAHVDASARLDPSARIDAGATVAAGAVIGARAWVGAGATVGANAVIGNDVRLHPRAAVLDGCRIGERSVVHSGAIIGGDGFGFAPLDGQWIKIPQIGAVVVGCDVEIGANTTIDRGTMGDTVIEDGVKLDNQIQIAHNCLIGAHTVMAGCAAVAGSAKIGRGCRIGGAAMIGGHLTIADGTDIGPATVVYGSITETANYTAFFPLMKRRDWERTAAVLRNLPGLRSRVRELEGLSDQRRRAPNGSPAPTEGGLAATGGDTAHEPKAGKVK